MSEYQYYEFHAIDRRLTEAELGDLRNISSRAQLSPGHASFVYNYGDFRGSPEQVLLQYFDAMLYIANWGSRQLAFRFPRAAVDVHRLQAYELSDAITVARHKDHILLDIAFHEEEPDWVDGEGLLTGLVSLRQDILQGDFRALYLAWLKGLEVESEDAGELIEPPVPPNLQDLSPALHNLIDFFNVNPDVIAVAAENSPSARAADSHLDQRIPDLPDSDKNVFLAKLLRGDAAARYELAKRLRELGPSPQPAASDHPRRTAAELLRLAEERARQRQAREREAA